MDDGWEDEPLCSVDASPGPESGHPAAATPSADTPREPVAGQPSMTPATISSADTTPILPWTPDQAGPATPTVLQEVVDQGPPYSPLPPTELHTLPELVRDRGRATRPGIPYGELSTVPREGDAADTALTGTERHYADIVTPRRQRRMCDCARCVGHALDLYQTGCGAGMPTRPGIRFARVPGVTVAAAAPEEIRRLEETISDDPPLALLACGRIPCTLHRNLLKTWLQAREFDVQATV